MLITGGERVGEGRGENGVGLDKSCFYISFLLCSQFLPILLLFLPIFLKGIPIFLFKT